MMVKEYIKYFFFLPVNTVLVSCVPISSGRHTDFPIPLPLWSFRHVDLPESNSFETPRKVNISSTASYQRKGRVRLSGFLKVHSIILSSQFTNFGDFSTSRSPELLVSYRDIRQTYLCWNFNKRNNFVHSASYSSITSLRKLFALW